MLEELQKQEENTLECIVRLQEERKKDGKWILFVISPKIIVLWRIQNTYKIHEIKHAKGGAIERVLRTIKEILPKLPR